MTDELRGLLRSAAGAPARPDHTQIRRRGRRLVAVRAASVAGIAAVVAVAAVGMALGLGAGDDVAPPVIGEPPPAPVEEESQEAPPSEGPIEETVDAGSGEVCAAPDLRPTYLPWLDDGEEVPEPTHVHQGNQDEPNGRLVWAEDPDSYNPTGHSETHMVVVASLADHEPSDDPDLPDVEVRGYPAELIWVGDPGVGALGLTWREGPAACQTYAVHLLIMTRPDVPDFLDLERSFAEAEAADGVDEAIRELEEAITAEMLRIADSLDDQGESAPAEDQDEGAPVEAEEDEAAPPTPCWEDDALRNAPPTDGDRAHLYLPCDGADHDPRPPVFRLDAVAEPTGDTEQDAAALLEELLEGPAAEQRARDYYGPADGQDISMRSVTFDGELLVVDLHFGEGGVNNLNTATASAIWHSSLQGTMFQLPEVERLELRLDGSCEDYLAYFQGDGCEQLQRSGAPWAID